MSCGSGYYFGAIITTILALVILSCFTSIEVKLSKRRKPNSNLSLLVKNEDKPIERLNKFFLENGIAVSSMEYRSVVQDGERFYKINVAFAKYIKVNDLNEFLAKIDNEFMPVQCKLSNETYTKSTQVRD